MCSSKIGYQHQTSQLNWHLNEYILLASSDDQEEFRNKSLQKHRLFRETPHINILESFSKEVVTCSHGGMPD